MALETTDNRKEYAGNGVTTNFSFPYYFLAEADLKVILRNDTTLVETLQVLTTNYTITGEGEEAGGTVTMLVAPPTGRTLIIYRDPEIIQDKDLRENDSLPAEQLEEGLDRAAMVSQRLAERVSRKLGVSDGTVLGDFDLTLPPELFDTGSAGKVFIVNEDEDGFEVGPTADEIEEAQANATAAAASAAAAAASASAAATAETNAELAETNAETAETNAELAETNAEAAQAAAEAAQAAAEAAQAAAEAAQAAAETAETNAETAETNAETAETNAELAETNAEAAQAAAAASASAADASADAAAISETNAAASAVAAAASAAAATGIANYANDAAYVSANGAAQTGDFYFNTTTSKIRFYNGSAWGDVGTGSGSGGINYITNSDAETDTSGWSMYADAAATSPVDGTGGSPSSTWTRSTSNPLRGLASFLLTKSAANRQGEGVGYAFSIADADKARMLTLSFEYEIDSGTYADNDVTFWIYDVTNSVLIQPSNYQLKNVGIESRHFLTFQTASNSTSYRLIAHISSTSASAYTLKFDSFTLGPQALSYGAPITDWVAYTPSNTMSTNTTTTAFWRRVGDTLFVTGKVAFTGAPNNVNPVIGLPSGLSIDTAKLGDASGNNNTLGLVAAADVGTAGYQGSVDYASATTVELQIWGAAGSYVNGAGITQTVPHTWANTDKLIFEFSVPIAGWSSNILLSSDADQRVVAARYTSASGQSFSTGTATTVDYATKDYDTHNAVTTGGSWVFTAPVPGYYKVKAHVTLANCTTFGAGEQTQVTFRKSGTDTSRLIYAFQASPGGAEMGFMHEDTIYLNAGQTLDVQFTQASGGSLSIMASAKDNVITIEKVQGPNTIGATELVAASYGRPSGQSINNATSTIIDFTTKVVDTHGAVTTGASWKFTAPVAGWYGVDALAQFTNSTANYTSNLILYKNGASFRTLARLTTKMVDGDNNDVTLGGSTKIRLVAGDYIDIRIDQGSGGALDLANDGVSVTYVDITRLGV